MLRGSHIWEGTCVNLQSPVPHHLGYHLHRPALAPQESLIVHSPPPQDLVLAFEGMREVLAELICLGQHGQLWLCFWLGVQRLP